MDGTLKKIVGVIAIFVAGMVGGYFVGNNKTTEVSNNNETITSNTDNNTNSSNKEKHNEEFRHNNKRQNADYERNDTGVVPQKAMEVLKYVRANSVAMEGYVGGRRFKNLENLLPKTSQNGKRINYQEWDVNPKIEGKNRGTQRLITGDDATAYYTGDHYRSFKKIE
jgi:ribonuclease T1